MVNKCKLLQNKIKAHSTDYLYPTENDITNINTHSWFDIKVRKQNSLFDDTCTTNIIFDNVDHDGFYTKEIIIYPTDKQKIILDKWFNCYILMYNTTTKYFKKCKFDKVTPILNITKLKKMFAEEKNNISKWSHLEFKIPLKNSKMNSKMNKNNEVKYKTENIHVDKHLLDYAINDATNRYKSCITNKKNGNIIHFRLRYLKMSKPNKILKIEKLAFKESGFYIRALGTIMICGIKEFQYIKNIITTATLRYENNNYKLLVKYKVPDLSDKNEYANKKGTISIDPGVRTWLTGYSNNKIVEINTQSDIIRKKLKQIDSIMERKDLQTKQNKIQNKKYTKIKNKIKDCQWKTIQYLVKNYKEIIIGNMSTKKIGETDIAKMTKRIANMYSLYQFKQRLKYKCKYTNTKYKEQDEAFTTQCCSNCSYRKKDIGSEKIYNCKKCGKIMDRDINSAINIMIAAHQ
jgi:transposase